jgi:hypothetical protein
MNLKFMSGELLKQLRETFNSYFTASKAAMA